MNTGLAFSFSEDGCNYCVVNAIDRGSLLFFFPPELLHLIMELELDLRHDRFDPNRPSNSLITGYLLDYAVSIKWKRRSRRLSHTLNVARLSNCTWNTTTCNVATTPSNQLPIVAVNITAHIRVTVIIIKGDC